MASKKTRTLKSSVMTLDELQRETLGLIRRMKAQLRKSPWQGGLSDREFIEHVLDPMQSKVAADREVANFKKRQR